MFKKTVSLILSLCLILSVNAAEEAPAGEAVPERTQTEEQPWGGREGMERTPPENMQGRQRPGGMPDGAMPSGEFTPPEGDSGFPQDMGRFPGSMQNGQSTAEEREPGFSGFIKEYFTPVISVFLLGFAFIFVIFYRRKNY